MTTGLYAHQSNLIKQMNAYGSLSDYNLNKIIRQCRDAINSAQTQQEATAIAAFLESALAEKGKGLSDVNGLDFNKLNGNMAGIPGLDGLQGDAKKAAKKQRAEMYKPLFNDLKAEFGLEKNQNKDKDWIEAAKKNDNIKIIDKNGQDVSKTFTGDKLKGYTLEINSQKHGMIKIQAGGDGVMNGGDDKIMMVGGLAATNSLQTGFNQINNLPGNQPNGTNNTFANGLLQAAGINPFDTNNPNAMLDTNAAMAQGFLTTDQIKSLIAAIMNNALFNINEQQQLQAAS